MDWEECLKKKIVKEVNLDANMISSLMKIAELKKESSDLLPADHYLDKITLLYDGVRIFLECSALKKGFKVYNHECYAAFLTEILKLSQEGEIFNQMRLTRNGINYYGREVTQAEAEEILKKLQSLFETCKRLAEDT